MTSPDGQLLLSGEKGKLFAAWEDGDTKFVNSTDDLRDLMGDDPELAAATGPAARAANPASSSGRASSTSEAAPGLPPPSFFSVQP